MTFMKLAARLAALCCIAVLTACGGGGGGSPSSSSQVTPPSATIKAESGASAGSSGSALQAAIGSTIVLASASTAGPGATITGYQWTLSSEPSGSRAVLSGSTTPAVSLAPDLAGSYSLQLQVTDSQGQTASQNVTIAVTTSAPVAAVVTKVVFNSSSTTAPAQPVLLGTVVSFDASVATSGNDPAAVTWQMSKLPSGSGTTLLINGTSSHFTPDVSGEYDVRVRATHAAGDYVEVTYVFEAGPAPSAVLVAQAGNSNSGTLSAYTNYAVVLDSSQSSAPPGDTLNRTWTLSTKPSSSTTQLSAGTGNIVHFVPDLPGTYVVTLVETDAQTGVTATYTETITVAAAPVAQVNGSATPSVQIAAPPFVSSPGIPVTLRGDGSYEPGGGTLTYSWTFASRPSGSNATIATPTAANVTFTPDALGAYVVNLNVTDLQGNTAHQTATINVGAFAPVAIVDQTRTSVVLGGSASVSAALSYDPESLPLTYSWSVDARPAGSSASIAAPSAAGITFTPDVAGTYTLNVTVNNGSLNSVASVTVAAFAPSSGIVPLSYLPLQAAFNAASNLAVIVSTNPDTLHVVDPTAGTDVGVHLPAGVKSLAMSPDGKLAAVLHEGVVSLVDLQTDTIINSLLTGGSQTMVEVTNSGLLYLLGQTGGQWVTPSITILNGRTGTSLTPANYYQVYGTTFGAYSDIHNKLFFLSGGLSPSEIYYITLDPTTGNTTGGGQAPYWGDYGMQYPLWLSGDQSLLFTAAGTYFSTANLSYIGNFNVGFVQSMSHSSVTQEAVVMTLTSNGYGVPVQYAPAYKRFTGSLLFAAPDVPLPLLNGQQSYGLWIFHNATGGHVMIVQTGTNTANGSGALYVLVLR